MSNVDFPTVFTNPLRNMPSVANASESEFVIRTLYEISGEYDLGFDHQIRRILRLGLKRFDLDVGILSNISGSVYRVVTQISPDPIGLEDGAEFPLGNTYCSITLASDEPVGLEHVANSSISNHPAYRSFGLESYVGVPVRVKHEVYGTLNFSSPDPRPREFSKVDLEALSLMAAWVGSELSRRQTEEELLKTKQILEQQSREDPLTHLFNRRGFEEKLVLLARRYDHLHRPLIGVVVDVDNFKAINDTFGHAFGDRVLISIAGAISGAVRPNDICARVGGDEFMILLNSCPLSEASEIAERVRSSVNALELKFEVNTIAPTLSCGVFPIPSDARAVTDLLTASCESLRKAKVAGKNTVAVG